MTAGTFVFETALADTLKATLETLVDDDTDGVEAGLVFPKWMDVRTMSDAYEDDLELGGPGLATETPEGQEMGTGSITEGVLYRYVARKFGIRLMITEETMEDSKYPMAIKAAQRCKRAIFKTADIDATNRLARAFNATYAGGDGVALASATHTLPNGGTFSNLMSPATSPSVAALTVARYTVQKFPGHDGVTDGVELKCAVFPTEQLTVWQELTGSKLRPEGGNFATINVVNDWNLDLVPVKYWTNTTTNWIMITTADNGLNFRWRRRPRSRAWVENSQEVMINAYTARWSHGWSDARGVFGSNA